MLNKYKKILIINGPNLEYVGRREKEIYGTKNIKTIDSELLRIATKKKIECNIFYSNYEGEIVEKIQYSMNKIDFIIINAGAYTHTSIAIRDAFLLTNIPFIEIHLSNPYKREIFRQKSYLSDIAQGIILGMNIKSYTLALYAAIDFCLEKKIFC